MPVAFIQPPDAKRHSQFLSNFKFSDDTLVDQRNERSALAFNCAGSGSFYIRLDAGVTKLAVCGSCVTDGLANCVSELIRLVVRSPTVRNDPRVINCNEDTKFDHELEAKLLEYVNCLLGWLQAIDVNLTNTNLVSKAQIWLRDQLVQVSNHVPWKRYASCCGQALGLDRLKRLTLSHVRAESRDEAMPVDVLLVVMALKLDDLGKAFQRMSHQLMSVVAEARKRRSGLMDPEVSDLPRENHGVFAW